MFSIVSVGGQGSYRKGGSPFKPARIVSQMAALQLFFYLAYAIQSLLVIPQRLLHVAGAGTQQLRVLSRLGLLFGPIASLTASPRLALPIIAIHASSAAMTYVPPLQAPSCTSVHSTAILAIGLAMERSPGVAPSGRRRQERGADPLPLRA